MNENKVEVTHEVFEVVQRERGRPRWKKVGVVFVDDGGREVVMLPAAKPGAMRELFLVAIDRTRRPGRTGTDPRRLPAFDVISGNGKGRRCVGAAWINRDGSRSVVVDDGWVDGRRSGTRSGSTGRRGGAQRSAARAACVRQRNGATWHHFLPVRLRGRS